jgi:lipopolysaccharide heptosyltransferase II
LKRRARKFAQFGIGLVFSAAGLVGWLLGDRAKTLRPSEVRRMLLIRLDLLGDVVLTMPAVRALRQRYPQAHIAMLVLPYTAPLVALLPYVDEVLAFDINKLRPSGEMLNPIHYRELWRLVRKLRRDRYDLCISFYGFYASLFSFISGARYRLGYSGESCPFVQNVSLPGGRYRERKHELEYNLTLAEAAGAVRDHGPLEFELPQEAMERVGRLLGQEGAATGTPLIALHPGASNGLAKRWPIQSWAALADRLVSEMGVRVVLTGSGAELSLANEVAGLMAAKPIIAAGQTTVPELVALLARCQAVVCGDSAPLHIAASLGIPSVALHGPTDPVISGPFGPSSIALRKEGCPPCYDLSDTAECSKNEATCIQNITVEEVYTALEKVLAGYPPGGKGSPGDEHSGGHASRFRGGARSLGWRKGSRLDGVAVEAVPEGAERFLTKGITHGIEGEYTGRGGGQPHPTAGPGTY